MDFISIAYVKQNYFIKMWQFKSYIIEFKSYVIEF